MSVRIPADAEKLNWSDLLNSVIAMNPKAPNDEMAEAVVRTLNDEAVRGLAGLQVAAELGRIRRDRVLTVERDAQGWVEPTRRTCGCPSRYPYKRCKDASCVEERRQYSEAVDAANKAFGDAQDKAWRQRKRSLRARTSEFQNYLQYPITFPGNLLDRDDQVGIAFRDWCQYYADIAHPDWLIRAAEAHGIDPDRVLYAWHYSSVVFNREIERMAQKRAAEMVLELTKDLLDSEFSVGDGRTVTWGTATLGDHQQRTSLLLAQAAGTSETAARHLHAISLLRERKASTLNELAEAEAA